MVLEILLSQLGVAGDMPARTEDRVAQWRAAVAQQRVLLVLDNAASADQVQPLLPGTDRCVTLITSRRHLAVLRLASGAVALDLGPLDQADGAALLRTIGAGMLDTAPTADVDELANLCGNLPVALRVAAAKLAGPSPLPLAGLLAALRDERGRLGALAAADISLTSAFGVTYRQLAAPAQRMFRLIGLHFGPSPSLDVCAAMAGIPRADARRALDELAQANLVQQPRRNRYTTHDLLRLYARGQSRATDDPAERDEGRRRALHWYLAAADVVDRMVYPGEGALRFSADATLSVDAPAFPNVTAGLDWLDAESANLVAAVTQGNRTSPDLAWRLTAQLCGWLERRAPLPVWISLNSIAAESAAAEHNIEAEALLTNGLGIAHGKRMALDQAAAAFRRTGRLRESIGDRRGAALALHNLGWPAPCSGWPYDCDLLQGWRQ